MAGAKRASNLNPANAVTASRFLCLPWFIWAVDRGESQMAMLAALVCGLLDLLDGKFARLFDCATPFGEVFDGIADGLCYGTMMVTLAAYAWVPRVAVALIVVMGFVNLWMRTVYAKRAGRTTNYRSFAMERLVAYGAYLVGIGTANFEVSFFYWCYLPLMVVVLVHDAKRMLIDPVPGAAPTREAPPSGVEAAS